MFSAFAVVLGSPIGLSTPDEDEDEEDKAVTSMHAQIHAFHADSDRIESTPCPVKDNSILFKSNRIDSALSPNYSRFIHGYPEALRSTHGRRDHGRDA